MSRGPERDGRVEGDLGERAPGADGPAAGRPPGRLLVRFALWSTALFSVTAVLAAVWPDPFVPVAVPVALVLFALGCGAFVWAYAGAVVRSREEEVDMAGVFFLAGGSAPTEVARVLRGALAVQVVVALVTAAVRPYTALAFGVLVPTLGLGLMAVWGARYGRFPRRPAESRSRPPRGGRGT